MNLPPGRSPLWSANDENWDMTVEMLIVMPNLDDPVRRSAEPQNDLLIHSCCVTLSILPFLAAPLHSTTGLVLHY